MTLRSLAMFAALAPAGCVSSHAVVAPTSEPVAIKAPPPAPAAKFQEFISVPGQYAAKNAVPEAPPVEPAPLWPTKAETVGIRQTGSLIDSPPPDPPLVLAWRDYLDGHTEKAIERIKDLDPKNQEILLRLMCAFAHAGKADLSGGSSTDAAVLLSQLEAATAAAAKLAPLEIRKACLVWKVTQFGVYDPLPEKHRFLPGGSGVLYMELQNAPTLPEAEIPAGGKGYVTRLTGSYYLADADGKPLAPPRKFEHAQYARSPVRDYFLSIEFNVPREPGNYSLVVELIDPASKRKAKQQVELKVGNQ